MTILTIVVTVLTALIFFAAAILKFRKDPHAMETRDKLGIAPAAYTLIGVCELAGATGALIGLAVRPLGIAALAGLVLVAIGACATQVRLKNPMSEARPAILALVLSVAALALQIATA
jgi:uncharacterized membrane protein YphA (DoxX/SURF4 family)